LWPAEGCAIRVRASAGRALLTLAPENQREAADLSAQRLPRRAHRPQARVDVVIAAARSPMARCAKAAACNSGNQHLVPSCNATHAPVDRRTAAAVPGQRNARPRSRWTAAPFRVFAPFAHHAVRVVETPAPEELRTVQAKLTIRVLQGARRFGPPVSSARLLQTPPSMA
jgi:hypothetical protein